MKQSERLRRMMCCSSRPTFRISLKNKGPDFTAGPNVKNKAISSKTQKLILYCQFLNQVFSSGVFVNNKQDITDVNTNGALQIRLKIDV